MAQINLGSIKFNWKGTYAGGTAYVVDDVVYYNGSSYVCILASTGNLPTDTTYWQLMAEGGDVATVLTTQGDILYRDGSGLQRLAAGTSGQLLQTGGSGANPSWVNAPSGVVKNIVYAYDTSQRSTTSATPVTASNTMGVTITPTSTSSLIYVSFDFSGGGNAKSNRMFMHIYRDSTDLGTIRTQEHYTTASDGRTTENPMTVNYIDQPNNTSAVTYTLRVAMQGGNTAYVNTNGRGMGMAIEYLL